MVRRYIPPASALGVGSSCGHYVELTSVYRPATAVIVCYRAIIAQQCPNEHINLKKRKERENTVFLRVERARGEERSSKGEGKRGGKGFPSNTRVLAKRHRLKLTEEKYKELVNRGKRIRSSGLHINYIINKEKGRATKVAIIVPKKTDQRAVKRQRTKRLLAQAMRRLLPELPAGYNFLITATRIFVQEKPEELSLMIKNSLVEAGVVDS